MALIPVDDTPVVKRGGVRITDDITTLEVYLVYGFTVGGVYTELTVTSDWVADADFDESLGTWPATYTAAFHAAGYSV